jgi:hypothetical protein
MSRTGNIIFSSIISLSKNNLITWKVAESTSRKEEEKKAGSQASALGAALDNIIAVRLIDSTFSISVVVFTASKIY